MATSSGDRTRVLSALLVVALLLLPLPGVARAETSAEGAVTSAAVRIEARLVDPTNDSEAGWGATGQILIPPQPADPALQRWQQARSLATSQARQSVTLAPGTGGLIRVGRGIPFAGWFLRHGTRCGLLETGTEWREVESALEVQVDPPAADGTVRLTLTPEFSYLSGRARSSVAFTGERAEVVLAAGVETRFTPPADLAPFYQRLLAGYDPVRRVWPVDLLLRVDASDAADGGMTADSGAAAEARAAAR